MTNNRPKIITAICIIGFIGTVITFIVIPITYSSVVNSIGTWYPQYQGFSAIMYLVCTIGLWKMKKWSIITYTVVIAINQIVAVLVLGALNIYGLIINAIIIAIVFSKYGQMK